MTLGRPIGRSKTGSYGRNAHVGCAITSRRVIVRAHAQLRVFPLLRQLVLVLAKCVSPHVISRQILVMKRYPVFGIRSNSDKLSRTTSIGH